MKWFTAAICTFLVGSRPLLLCGEITEPVVADFDFLKIAVNSKHVLAVETGMNFQPIWVLDIKSGEVVRRIDPDWKRVEDNYAFCAVAISPDGQTIASQCNDGAIRFWNLKSGKLFAKQKLPIRALFSNSSSLAYSSNGKFLATALPKKIVVCDGATGKQIAQFPHAGHSVAWTPDNKFLVSANGNSVSIIEVETMAMVNHFSPKSKDFRTISSICVSSDGKLIAVGTQWQGVVVFDSATGKENARMNRHRDCGEVMFSPDSKFLTAVRQRSPIICVWDMHKRKQPVILGPHQKNITDCGFASFRNSLVVADNSQTITLWDWQKETIIWETTLPKLEVPREKGRELSRFQSNRDNVLRFLETD